ncbi:DEP domain-containing protein 1A isoform X1 [Astyanax mexicanus]|uniref:DEP domain-containing protein 1A isoform X1 n=1 Tax=Astyanax mexicanus TaxID=7994 RepID=UPI0020CAC793|nr:DEP domain-containing protein 1A isoform X1 [Astyanax mexicanus]
MDSRIITPGPYRATKLWNEVTKLFRAGMPLKKHRQHFKVYTNCFTATAAVDWLHELLRNNSNFGQEVTRQQTVQLLKKFFKNHVIEDVKGRWGLEDLEDNSQLYRFPSTSPLKPIPGGPEGVRKKSFSLKDREGFFKLRGSKKFDKEIQENIAPVAEDSSSGQHTEETENCRDITDDDIQEIWRSVTLTHLQKLLGLPSLEEVLNPAQVNPRFIVYNMTKVNKHGVVTLEDKTDDLPHWVLSAMKCLANWPKYDSNQPSYPGFERDVFKFVSDYFYSLPEPLLTFQFYELFVNVLVLCGYVPAPRTQRGKRKNLEELSCPQPPKAPHLNTANLFRSTECLLLSLIRKESFDETDSPMKEVFTSKVKSQAAASRTHSTAAPFNRLRPRSCSLERILDESADSCSKPEIFKSVESLASCRTVSSEGSHPQDSSLTNTDVKPESKTFSSMTVLSSKTPSGEANLDDNQSQTRSRSSFNLFSEHQPTNQNQKSSRPRPRSVGNCLDLLEHKEMSASCFSINAPVAEITMRPDLSSSTVGLRGHSMVRLHGSCLDVSTGPTISRRCYSSLDLCKPVHSHPSVSSVARRLSPDQRLLQPALERLAIEALQLCTLLLPPVSRRKLQLLLRMISRMSQNVDMPRLHDAIGTRTLLVQTFSRCVLSCEEEVDLDELLATRLLSFLMDHHQEILQVPLYLRNAVEDHISYLRSQPRHSGMVPDLGMPAYSFCRQISAQEFEEQKLSVSQAAIAELLESLIKDKAMSVKEKKKKLKLFQKEYPDIYLRRFPTTESEAQLFADKPKIKPPLLMGLKKTKAFSIRN